MVTPTRELTIGERKDNFLFSGRFTWHFDQGDIRETVMDHFEFQVGTARVQVHQALGTDKPFIRIQCGGEEKTLTVLIPTQLQPAEIKLEAD